MTSAAGGIGFLQGPGEGKHTDSTQKIIRLRPECCSHARCGVTKVKIADDLGVAVGELEYVRTIGHDVSWVVQLRRSGMNRAFFGSALATLLFAGQAPAQPYPSRPVTFIVPYGAGGPVDTLARILSEPMRKSLGQPVIVENVTGASGTIGVARAVRAAPDGYTVSIGNWPSHVVNGAIYTLPYDIRTDFEPV